MMDYVIIPQSWEVGYVRYLLLAQPRMACAARGCWVVESDIHPLPQRRGLEAEGLPDAQVKEFASESAVALPDQYRYGMRTSPRDAVIKRIRPGRGSNSESAAK